MSSSTSLIPAVRPPGAARSSRRGAWLAPYGFVGPTLLFIAVLAVVPIGMVIGYSLFDNVITTPDSAFVGLANYVAVITDPAFLGALGNTAWFIGLSTLVHLVLGLAFAMLLNTKMFSPVTKAVFRVIYVLPWLFTIAVIAVVWRLILDPYGVANAVMSALGIGMHGTQWLADPSTALGAITFINVWSGYPFFMISLLAALQGVPESLFEAARVDGANWGQRFRYVILPQLRPVLVSMAVLDLIWTSQQFALIWMTTGGGPLGATEMLSTYTYKQAFSNYDFSAAAASAVIVLLLTMVLAAFYVRSQTRRA
ncbi:Carbohydrate ABC transporter membrane protein 1 (CUT1 family) [Microbacterium sp. 8M]|uniref:carbohydrate ABC transporter permease n=1 Tax=Microbacterium sp. 8M TaxID=2653153 RepID=UPI0012F12AE6|nr:sugar ABC transporter permease [Microbacterium sp. 8M]VXA91415.1 Carbohydrate ABC transporter membrane protein 1 (CUT1 family) [Microbacterium sp. 8M]